MADPNEGSSKRNRCDVEQDEHKNINTKKTKLGTSNNESQNDESKTSDVDKLNSAEIGTFDYCMELSTDESSTTTHVCVADYEEQSDANGHQPSICHSDKFQQKTLDHYWGKSPASSKTDDAADEDGNSQDEDDVASVSSIEEVESCQLGLAPQNLPSSWISPPSLPTLSASSNHVILFSLSSLQRPFQSKLQPIPQEVSLEEAAWDNKHVRLPYSPQNKFVDSGKRLVERWPRIVASLKPRTWSTSADIEKAIMSYNKYNWDFSGLHSYCNRMTDTEKTHFFKGFLPKIADLALRLPSLCTQSIALLTSQQDASVTMSQEQAACLLANAFFCTFPSRNVGASRLSDSSPQLPSINFNGLFRKPSKHHISPQYAKLDCLLNYFRRVTSNMPTGSITFRRKVLSPGINWPESNTLLTDLCVSSDGKIEDNADGFLQVDFANKFIGGGVLGEGCVQEEIRFLICPEMIISRLITEVLDDNESLVMTGCERFSNYSGYGSSFRWSSDHVDQSPRDDWGRRMTEVVAIDAEVFRSLTSQLTEKKLRRELNKAYCGFHDDASGSGGELCAVATGNWGCGAFGGDHRLKALLQIMAAAEAGRAVRYFTFGDGKLCREMHELHEAVRNARCTVGRLWKYIQNAAADRTRGSKFTTAELYQYIIEQCHGSTNSAPASPSYANTP